MLHAVDEFGNALTVGGALVIAKAYDPLTGTSVTVDIEDRRDGTYRIRFTWQTVGECEVSVRIENRDMAPVRVAFADPSDQEEQERQYRALKAKAEAQALAWKGRMSGSRSMAAVARRDVR